VTWTIIARIYSRTEGKITANFTPRWCSTLDAGRLGEELHKPACEKGRRVAYLKKGGNERRNPQGRTKLEIREMRSSEEHKNPIFEIKNEERIGDSNAFTRRKER